MQISRVFIVDPSLFSLHYDIEFANALADKGCEVHLIGRHLRDGETIAHARFHFNPLFYRLGEHPRLRHYPSVLKCVKALEHIWGLIMLYWLTLRLRPDVVHFQWLVFPMVERLIVRLLKQTTQTVLTVHNSTIFHGSPHVSSLQNMAEQKARESFEGYICHTKSAAQTLAVKQYNVCVLAHPPLTIGGTLNSSNNIATTIHNDHYKSDFLFFGAIKPYKGLDLFIDACLALCPGRKIKVRIAGKPFYDISGIIQKIEDTGYSDQFVFDLRFIPDDEIRPYFRNADVVVLPYHEIDASGVLGVAVEEGRNIIASRVGVFAEEPYRSALSLFERGQKEPLTTLLKRYLDDPAWAHQAQMKICHLREQMMTWDEFAGQTLRFYQRSALNLSVPVINQKRFLSFIPFSQKKPKLPIK